MMQINFFTTACLAALLVPLGQFIWSLREDRPFEAMRRFALSIGLGVAAFVLIGAAILQGNADQLVAMAPERLLGRHFDSASLHHATLVAMVCGLLAATARHTGALALGSILLGGVALPAAMKWVWFGPLMRAGVLDITGAAPLHALGGACAMALSRMTAKRDDLQEQSFPRLALLGPILMVMGWIAYVLAAGVMQSSATATAGALNTLRAATVAGLVMMAIAKFRRDRDAALNVTTAVILAMASIAAAAGRAPWAIVVGLGVLAAIIASLRLSSHRWFGVRDSSGLLLAHLFGAVIGMIVATPFAVADEPTRLQLGLQTITVLMCAGAGAFVGLAAGLLGGMIAYRPPAQAVSEVR